MKFIVEINCDNSAFGFNKNTIADEVDRILGVIPIGELSDEPNTVSFLRDINGNLVGTAKFVTV